MSKSVLSGTAPILAFLNTSEAIQFYGTVLGFTKIHLITFFDIVS